MLKQWKVFCEVFVGGRRGSRAQVWSTRRSQNRNYIGQPILKNPFLIYGGNIIAKEKELLISFALHEFLEHCWAKFFCGLKPAPGVFPGLCTVNRSCRKISVWTTKFRKWNIKFDALYKQSLSYKLYTAKYNCSKLLLLGCLCFKQNPGPHEVVCIPKFVSTYLSPQVLCWKTGIKP